MRTIGIDLAITAAHKAVVMDANGQFVTPVLSFYTSWEETERLVARARAALAQLQAAGIRPVMLSGDNPHTSAAVAAALGLTEYGGHCPPPDKAARIRTWRAGGERVATPTTAGTTHPHWLRPT